MCRICDVEHEKEVFEDVKSRYLPFEDFPINLLKVARSVVGGTRLELATSTMSTWRSNQLS